MWGSRRNKIYPRGNPAIVRSIPAVLPQHSYPHPQETRRFRGIPAVPISVHTSLQCISTWDNTKLDFISDKQKTTNGRNRAKLRATFVCLGAKAEIFTIHLNSVNSVLRRRPAYDTASSSSFSDGADQISNIAPRVSKQICHEKAGQQTINSNLR